jgi:hypothetical protein
VGKGPVIALTCHVYRFDRKDGGFTKFKSCTSLSGSQDHNSQSFVLCNMTTAGPIAPAPAAEVPTLDANKSLVDIKTREKANAESLPFDPVALKEKYLAERDRRLARGEGVEQYTLIDGSLSHFLKDPWVEPGFEREPIEEETEVVIVGGGYGAQLVAVRLMEVGVRNFRIVEKAGDFGGTCE